MFLFLAIPMLFIIGFCSYLLARELSQKLKNKGINIPLPIIIISFFLILLLTILLFIFLFAIYALDHH
jgi:hypothetical protein